MRAAARAASSCGQLALCGEHRQGRGDRAPGFRRGVGLDVVQRTSKPACAAICAHAAPHQAGADDGYRAAGLSGSQSSCVHRRAGGALSNERRRAASAAPPPSPAERGIGADGADAVNSGSTGSPARSTHCKAELLQPGQHRHSRARPDRDHRGLLVRRRRDGRSRAAEDATARRPRSRAARWSAGCGWFWCRDRSLDRAALAGADSGAAACWRYPNSRRDVPAYAALRWVAARLRGDVPRADRQMLAAHGQRLADGGERHAKERADHRWACSPASGIRSTRCRCC